MKAFLVAVLLAALPLAAQEQRFGETIDVVRYVIPARVVDPAGRAITDLAPAEFTARIGGKTAVVESAEWLGSGEPAVTDTAPVAGRLIVIFIQTDFGRAPARVIGQMKFNDLSATILAMLEPEDYVAVASHDSHLKLQCDFTRDRELARAAIYRAIEIRRQGLPPAPESGPSLARHLELEQMRRASSAGAALRLVANALDANDGQKVVILGGWGMGELLNGRVLLDRKWGEAMSIFRNARTPVITLGTGLGGQLTYGLVATARETGGFYAGTQHFAEQSMTRLRGVLAGYYELVLRVDGELPPGDHEVDLRTTRRNANVLVAPLRVVHGGDSVEVVEIPDPAPPAESAAGLHREALQKLRDGDAEGAEALFTRAIELGGAPEESWYERGLLRAARGELDAAAEDLRAYLDRAPRGRRADEARALLHSWR